MPQPPQIPHSHRSNHPLPGASGAPYSSGHPMGNPGSGHPYGHGVQSGMVPPQGIVRQQGSLLYLTTRYVSNACETFVFDTSQRPIGGGAMGTVYRGQSLKDGRPVAIKQVNPRYASVPAIRRRAHDEAALAFAHPNLIEMLACVEWPKPGGPLFIISRYVNGITLDKHVSRNMAQFSGRDRQKRIIESLYPVCEALDYLHAKGVLHLDIKPTNIMIENGRTMRLMDLGIAFTPDQKDLTGSGLLGTSGYAAPEQYVVDGQHAPFNAATDVYELAATMYQMLTGQIYNPLNPDFRLCPIPDVPGATNAVLLRALSPSNPDRYQSAGEFRRALEQSFVEKPAPQWWKILLIVFGVLFVLAVVVVAILMTVL